MKSTRDVVEEEQEAFLPNTHNGHDQPPISDHRNNRWRPMHFLRILIELAMAFAITFLLSTKSKSAQSPILKSPVPQLPRKLYTFNSDPRYIRDDMFLNESTTLHTLHQWIPLSSESRGYIVIPDPLPYDLPAPYTIAIDRHNDGPGYMMSVFHQLHCLSYLAEHFQRGYGGVELDHEVAHHTAHCFNYLRQGIMCNADTTLEGKTDAGPGEGSVHECVDYEALLAWANEHGGMRWRNALMPEDSIL